MTFLLDTHAFLWFISGDARLNAAMKAIICDPSNTRLLSYASLWEIIIKVKIGKLPLKGSIDDLIRDDIIQNDIQLLPITLQHLHALDKLPLHHRDPFDRLIIAQSLAEKIPFMSADPKFDGYGIQRL